MSAAAVSLEFADMLDEEKRAVDEWLIDALDLAPGDEVLEVACGTAGTGLLLAATRPEARVVCSDLSDTMLDAARVVADECGIGNVTFRTLDAERLALMECSVDGVLCRLGFHVMANPGAALVEAHRVLRPGRALAFAVWSERTHNPWRALPEDAVGIDPPLPGPPGFAPGPFSLADPLLLRRMLADAGFVDVHLARVRADQRYESPEQFWGFCLRKSGSLRAAMDRLEPSRQDRVKRRAVARLRERCTAAEGFVLPAEMLVATGRA